MSQVKSAQEKTACCPAIKIKSGASTGKLQSELEERKGKICTAVDPKRTHLNRYFLIDRETGEVKISAAKPPSSLQARIDERLEKYGAKPRDTEHDRNRPHDDQRSVVCESIILQISHNEMMKYLEEDDMLDGVGMIRNDKELPEDGKTMTFFKQSFNWAIERFGSEFVISGYLHVDELTPHMHVQVVPLLTRVKTYKNGEKKKVTTLNAKKVFSPTVCGNMWREYAGYLQQKGYDVDIAEGHKPKGYYEPLASINAYMAKLDASIAEKEAEAAKMRKEFEDYERKLERYRAIKEKENTPYAGFKYVLPERQKRMLGEDYYNADDVDALYQAMIEEIQKANQIPDLRPLIADLESLLDEKDKLIASLKKELNSPARLKKRISRLEEKKEVLKLWEPLEKITGGLQTVVSYKREGDNIELFTCKNMKNELSTVVVFGRDNYYVVPGYVKSVEKAQDLLNSSCPSGRFIDFKNEKIRKEYEAVQNIIKCNVPVLNTIIPDLEKVEFYKKESGVKNEFELFACRDKSGVASTVVIIDKTSYYVVPGIVKSLAEAESLQGANNASGRLKIKKTAKNKSVGRPDKSQNQSHGGGGSRPKDTQHINLGRGGAINTAGAPTKQKSNREDDPYGLKMKI